MAIQIRRGTNTEWESNNSNIVVGEPAIATDAERFFVGTASGNYAEFANLDIIAPAYDTTASYVVGDVINRQGKLYSCNTPCSGTFNVSYWDEKSLAEILKDLENEITYAQYEIGYASGKLITISNGASEIPVKDLTLDIEAVQDLHGYDHPWVGGGGKNLLKVTNFTVGQTKTGDGLTCTYNADGSFTIDGTTTDNNAFFNLNYANGVIALPKDKSLNIGYAIKSGTNTDSAVKVQAVGDTDYTIHNYASNNAFGMSPDFLNSSSTAHSTWLRIQVQTSGTTVNNLTILPFFCLSSNKLTQYEPYENICPISGWDEVNVNVVGKNLLDVSNTTSASSAHVRAYNLNLDAGTYTISAVCISTADTDCLCLLIYEDGTTSPYNTLRNNNWSKITINATKRIAELRIYASTGYSISQNYTVNVAYVQLEFGSTATAYEPYNGQTYTTDLDGTRYGGTLDVTTGVLTITKFQYAFSGNETFLSNSAWGDYAFLYNTGISLVSSVDAKRHNICSHLVLNEQGAWTTLTPNHFMVAGGSYIGLGYDGTQTELKAWLTAQKNAGTPVQVVGLLATPQVVQLTPTQVRTVLGMNNIWNQMNTNNELAYRISNALN